MISTVIATFPWIIAVAFCITDIPGVLTGPAGSISFMSQLFYNVSGGSQAATVGLTMFLPVMGFCGVGPSIISATSRIIWSFARDGGLPKAVSTVSDRTKTPIWALFITWLSICALSCVYIGNATAYYGLSSACTVTLMISYASPLLLNVMFGFQHCSLPRGRFTLGRWHRPMAVARCAWSLCLIVMMCFPTVQPIRLENMNYASVVTVGGIVAATVCWFLYGRKQYIGLVPITDGVPTS
jgi:choline transport protein